MSEAGDNGAAVKYSYDALGRLTLITPPGFGRSDGEEAELLSPPSVILFSEVSSQLELHRGRQGAASLERRLRGTRARLRRFNAGNCLEHELEQPVRERQISAKERRAALANERR